MALPQHVVQGCQAELELSRTKSRERHFPLIDFPASQIQALSRLHTETLQQNTDQEPLRSKNGIYICIHYPWFFSWSHDSEFYSFYRCQCFMFTHTILSMGEELFTHLVVPGTPNWKLELLSSSCCHKALTPHEVHPDRHTSKYHAVPSRHHLPTTALFNWTTQLLNQFWSPFPSTWSAALMLHYYILSWSLVKLLQLSLFYPHLWILKFIQRIQVEGHDMSSSTHL